MVHYNHVASWYIGTVVAGTLVLSGGWYTSTLMWLVHNVVGSSLPGGWELYTVRWLVLLMWFKDDFLYKREISFAQTYNHLKYFQGLKIVSNITVFYPTAWHARFMTELLDWKSHRSRSSQVARKRKREELNDGKSG